MHLVENGLDHVIMGEPQGFELAMTVRSKIVRTATISDQLNAMVNQLNKSTQMAAYLTKSIHSILWDYGRARLAKSIPPVDPSIPPGNNVREIDGLVFGPMLGQGMFGSVHKAGRKNSETVQVVKVLDKSTVKDISGLMSYKRMIDVMTMLSTDWPHPNIANLHEVFHSTTHMFLVMEYGGPENLYRRLKHRTKSDLK